MMFEMIVSQFFKIKTDQISAFMRLIFDYLPPSLGQIRDQMQLYFPPYFISRSTLFPATLFPALKRGSQTNTF